MNTFKQALQNAGIEPPAEIIADGALHRFTVAGDRARSDNGWYVLHADEPAAGAFGCWKRGLSEAWSSKAYQIMNQAEKAAYTAKMEAVKKLREEERERKQAECRKWCTDAWDKAKDATNENDYLKRKGVHAYELKSYKDSLLVPVQGMAGTIHGLQFISPDGSKKYKTGTNKAGHFFKIGKNKDKTIIICEGYATGASIHQATGHAVIIAFDSGNLIAVSQNIRSKFPDIKIIIAADDDHATEGNPGLTKATEAARAVKGLLAIPDFPSDRGDKDTDFNDFRRLSGADAVRSCINGAKAMDMIHEEPIKEDKKIMVTKTERLIQLALGKVELFHDADQKAFATIKSGDHRETYPLRSKGFRTWLSGRFWAEYKEGVGGQIIQDALGTLEGHAIHDGSCYPVYVRLGVHNANLYLDLGNDQHEVVEITATGWSILKNQNLIKFRRPSGMAALPYPTTGGSLESLRKYINLSTSEDWPILVGYILMCFNPWGPYPILSFTGEQGSAKSTGQKVIKAITDPSSAPLRSMPKETRDLAITSMNQHVLAYDNLSDISGHMSDALCRQATGSGFATRTLYSDDEETIINTKRPIMLNGIDNVIRRHDLADRSIIINLAVIPDEKRIPEADFWLDFEDDAPEVLGAILDAVSCSLMNHKNVSLSKVPRMADFAIWVTAAEVALGWEDGTFLKAYSINRREVTALTLDADQVGTAVKTFMERRSFEAWEGTASELLDALDGQVDDRTKKGKYWPRSANTLSGKVKRSATALRTEGIEVTIGHDRQSKKRFIRLEQVPAKIVSIVSDQKKDTHVDDATDIYLDTMFEEKIVPGSSPKVKDRTQYQRGDDDGDDALKKIVPNNKINDSVKAAGYKQGDDGGGGDDDSPPPFQSDNLREVTL